MQPKLLKSLIVPRIPGRSESTPKDVRVPEIELRIAGAPTNTHGCPAHIVPSLERLPWVSSWPVAQWLHMLLVGFLLFIEQTVWCSCK